MAVVYLFTFNTNYWCMVGVVPIVNVNFSKYRQTLDMESRTT